MDLQIVNGSFSVCKVNDIEKDLLKKEYTFIGKTDQELSLFCKTEHVPNEVITVEHGWRCFRIAEDASFEKYGMIAFLANIIAAEKTCTLVVGTYDTDYIFIKEDRFEEIKSALLLNGCQFL